MKGEGNKTHGTCTGTCIPANCRNMQATLPIVKYFLIEEYINCGIFIL